MRSSADATGFAGPLPIATVQDEALEIALELQRIDRRLATLQAAVQLPVDAVEIWEDEAAATVEIEVEGVLGIVRDDALAEAVNLLRGAATITPERLRTQHARRVAERAKLDARLDAKAASATPPIS